MKRLAKVGFTQSYTYFTWRNDEAGADRVSDRADARAECREYMRPNFFANTPGHQSRSILQTGGRAGFRDPAGAGRDASAATTASTAASSCARRRAGAGQGGISRLREVRDPRLGLGPARQHQGRHPPGQRAPPRPPGAAATSATSPSTTPGTTAGARTTASAPPTAPISCCSPSTSTRTTRRAPTSRCRSGSSACPTTPRSRSEDLISGGRFTWHGKVQPCSLDPARALTAAPYATHGQLHSRRSEDHASVTSPGQRLHAASATGTRTRSSTSSTSRPSSTPTATASATSPG